MTANYHQASKLLILMKGQTKPLNKQKEFNEMQLAMFLRKCKVKCYSIYFYFLKMEILIIKGQKIKRVKYNFIRTFLGILEAMHII